MWIDSSRARRRIWSRRVKPNDIIQSLSKSEQRVLNAVLEIEKRNLHIDEIKRNSRTEKEIISNIINVINKAVDDAD